MTSVRDKFFHVKIQKQYAEFVLEGISLAVSLAWGRLIDKTFQKILPNSSTFTTTFLSAMVLTLIATWLINYINRLKTPNKIANKDESLS